MTKDREPRPGEIRAVNYHVKGDGPVPILRHRLEQYHPAPWGVREGQWRPIRVYHEGEDGELMEVPQ